MAEGKRREDAHGAGHSRESRRVREIAEADRAPSPRPRLSLENLPRTVTAFTADRHEHCDVDQLSLALRTSGISEIMLSFVYDPAGVARH